jgi:2-oxoglutarate dehydrogenase complex dehydrogenase (E1) component-like enzyme
MYEKIKNHPSVFEIYSKKCLETGAVTVQEIDDLKAKYMKEYEEDYKKVMSDKTDYKPEIDDPFEKLQPI